MQTVERKFRSVFCDVPIQVPSSVADYDALAGKEGACLASAIENVVYRGVLSDFRDLLIHGREAVEAKPAAGDQPAIEAVEAVDGLEQLTGISRKTIKKTVGKKEVEVYDETEADYVRRIIAAKGWDQENPIELQQIADNIAKFLIFNPKEVERAARGPKKLPEDYKNAATRIIENNPAFKDKYARFNITWTEEKDKNIELLGWKIREEVLEEQRKKTAAYE